MRYAKPAITFSAQADLLLARGLEGASKAQLVAKLDAIERAEVAIRTRIVNQHALAHGPFGYLDRANLPGLQVHEHRDLLDRIREEARRSREAFATHFFAVPLARGRAHSPEWMPEPQPVVALRHTTADACLSIRAAAYGGAGKGPGRDAVGQSGWYGAGKLGRWLDDVQRDRYRPPRSRPFLSLLSKGVHANKNF